MKVVHFLLSLLATTLLISLFNNRLADLPVMGNLVKDSPASGLPPIGRFLDPFHGFWQNAEGPAYVPFNLNKSFSDLQENVKVSYDDRMIPHIFAQNDEDLYFAQGYVTAQHRLWQMELQTHAAAGRLSEIAGERLLFLDKQQRRKGMVFGAENKLGMMKADPEGAKLIEAYTAGVNAYINQLNYTYLPLEYKLLDYRPESWTILKSALLLMNMADDLTGYERDIEMTNALTFLGQDHFDLFYPNHPKAVDPIIPAKTNWQFDSIPLTIPLVPGDSSAVELEAGKTLQGMLLPKPDPTYGSNNWAVSGEKTVSKAPILCGDPHLALNLPSIWYEIQLSTPEKNVYGVSLPGGPGVTIGFNGHIAWSLTNTAIDVKDWYQIQFKDDKKEEYLFEGEWRKTTKKVESFAVRNQEMVYDTVVYTHFGPVVYENDTLPKNNMALRWKAHDASNELKAMHLMNNAKNYSDYINALQYYECPAQNMVFADARNDIAIWSQGKFPLKWEGQGRMVLDGTRADNEWQGFIPQAHNPHILNPKRHFVSSANQHPTDDTYPYFYTGKYEHYRNRRINQQLTAMKNITVADMKALQVDNYNLKAADILPTLLNFLTPDSLNATELKAYETLKKWNFLNEKEQKAPTIWTVFWEELKTFIWDEFPDAEQQPLPYPSEYSTTQLIIKHPSHPFMDDKRTTDVKETVVDLIPKAFSKAIGQLTTDKETVDWSWGAYRKTKILHLLRLAPFSYELATNGDKKIVNAIGERAGPSWRMVVAFPSKAENATLEDKTFKAWGVYPGGQSGNPGSPHYIGFLDKWLDGEYYELNYWANAEEAEKSATFSQSFNKEQ